MSEKSTAFALIGDRYHNSDYIRTGLKKTLVKDLGLSIDFTDEVSLLSAETLSGYELLIIFRDPFIWPEGYGDKALTYSRGGETVSIVSEPPVTAREAKCVVWITSEQGEVVKTFVSNGGSALLYHNTTYTAAEDDAFRDALGAVTQGHTAIRPYKVEITNQDHPITRGVRDFVVTDEQHFMTYEKDPKHLFMWSVNEDGLTHRELGTTCEAGWSYDFAKGRVCYLSPGHTLPALWNPEYEKIQQNAVRWLLREI